MRIQSVFIATIVGFICSAPLPLPVIPRWMDASSDSFGGQGFLLSKAKGAAQYVGFFELSYDFDYNCYRKALSNYESREFTEETLCNGIHKRYTSETDQCLVEKTNTTVESMINSWAAGFVKYLGNSFADPAFGKGSYKVVKNMKDGHLLYLRDKDNVIEFLVDTTDPITDLIYYFPAGVSQDQSVLGVWDFNMKYGSCPSKPEITSVKTFAAQKNLLAYNQTREEARLQQTVEDFFEEKDPNHDGYITLSEMMSQGGRQRDIAILKRIDTDGDNCVSKAEYLDFLREYLYGSGYRDSQKLFSLSSVYPTVSFWDKEDSLTKQVDEYFLYADLNDDGKITLDEVRIQLEKEGESLTERQLTATFKQMDLNGDGSITKGEMYDFSY